MRIVGGVFRGRQLVGPKTSRSGASQTIRPTTDKTRLAMFNSLSSWCDIEGSSCLDLFCGTGALGIEALSRGAKSVAFVDKSVSAIAIARNNVVNLDVDGRCSFFAKEATSYLKEANMKQQVFDLAFVDPPYAFGDWSRLLAIIPASIFVVESNGFVELPDHWSELKRKSFGDTHFQIVSAIPTTR